MSTKLIAPANHIVENQLPPALFRLNQNARFVNALTIIIPVIDRSSCTNLINNTSTGISYSPTNATTFFEPEESTTPSLEKHTFIVPSTVHPPAVCVSNNFIPLIQYLNDQVTFDASTSKGPMFPYIDLPLKDKVLKNSDRFWEPVYNDINQW